MYAFLSILDGIGTWRLGARWGVRSSIKLPFRCFFSFCFFSFFAWKWGFVLASWGQVFFSFVAFSLPFYLLFSSCLGFSKDLLLVSLVEQSPTRICYVLCKDFLVYFFLRVLSFFTFFILVFPRFFSFFCFVCFVSAQRWELESITGFRYVTLGNLQLHSLHERKRRMRKFN